MQPLKTALPEPTAVQACRSRALTVLTPSLSSSGGGAVEDFTRLSDFPLRQIVSHKVEQSCDVLYRGTLKSGGGKKERLTDVDGFPLFLFSK